ncbi:MAG: Trk system potassium transporter TrkA [Methanotrichaceae archaeon]
MRILITGAGEVGFLVASELHEDHDVTVIDKDPCACEKLQDIDVQTFQGNAANARLLIDAGIKKADIVLAVTGNDEVNVITCIIASHLGAKRTIARVSNPEYIDRPLQDRREIGISYMVCPELALAEDLARTLYFPSMLMNRELAEGKIELIEFKVTEKMPIIGPIEEINLPGNCKVIAVNRAGNIFIPEKGYWVMPNDHLLLLCDSKAMPSLRSMLHEASGAHRVMIVGGGMVGFYLASRLEKAGFNIKLIELNENRCREIAEKLSGTMILSGDGTDISLLTKEGAGDMDVIFAVTGIDEKNLLCSLLVKQLGVTKILSRVNRNAYIKLFEIVGVDRAISPGQVTADVVLQHAIGGEEVVTLSDRRIELVDFIAKDESKIVGKVIPKELPRDVIVGMVLRRDKIIIPENGFKVEKGDRVFIMSMPHEISHVKRLFKA